jgi:hypothetical protein
MMTLQKKLQQFGIFFLSNKTRFNLVPQVFHNNTILTSTHPPKIASAKIPQKLTS